MMSSAVNCVSGWKGPGGPCLRGKFTAQSGRRVGKCGLVFLGELTWANPTPAPPLGGGVLIEPAVLL